MKFQLHVAFSEEGSTTLITPLFANTKSRIAKGITKGKSYHSPDIFLLYFSVGFVILHDCTQEVEEGILSVVQ